MRISNLRQPTKLMAAAAATLVLLSQLACVSVPLSGTGAPSVTRAPFGSIDGQAVELFTLTNAHGIQIRLTNYGGIITSPRNPHRRKLARRNSGVASGRHSARARGPTPSAGSSAATSSRAPRRCAVTCRESSGVSGMIRA
jgi:hypothetical protein